MLIVNVVNIEKPEHIVTLIDIAVNFVDKVMLFVDIATEFVEKSFLSITKK
ncbi:hypothetical protein AB1282_03055 [Gottfriedia sp. S16(2024)]|uniref:hypothetical protein n=1 Tax=Gottfriedia sp. S16(2024) TaxID=3162883 RepID=UPI003D1DC620